jgi:AbrB family looped-hinge helix DNA binding protein
MMMEVITVDAKGHLAIPKDLREKLNLKSGDKLVVFNRGDFLIFKKVEGEMSVLQVLAQTARERLKEVGISTDDVQDAVSWARDHP